MKNIHILPTDKPTTLFKDDFDNFIYSINIDQEQNHFEPQHIYITSDEKIKEGDWFYNSFINEIQVNCNSNGCKKIILTTDQDLIKDGVQAIDDEFLEWFVKNPSCEFADVNDCLDDNGNIVFGGNKRYQICNHITKEEPKQTPQLNISDVISSKNHLTKDEIISTGDWYEADYINLMEGYFWKHKNIEEDGYVFYMRRYKNDGFTTIVEEGKDDNKLFEGYIKNIEELKQIVHLCRLHEI